MKKELARKTYTLIAQMEVHLEYLKEYDRKRYEQDLNSRNINPSEIKEELIKIAKF